jgi:hypothetical protein
MIALMGFVLVSLIGKASYAETKPQSVGSSAGTVALTYIAGVTPRAAKMLDDDFGHLYVFCDKCSQINEENRRRDMGSWTISKDNLWVPFIYQEFRNRYSESRVILDPSTIDLDRSGKLVLRTTLEDGVVDRRIFFLAYSEPYGYWGMKTIANFLIAILVDMPQASLTGTDFDWTTLHSSLIVPKKTPTVSGYASKASWEAMMATGPGKVNGEVVVKAVQRAVKSGTTEQVPAGGCASRYGALLGLSAINEDLCGRMRAREISFRVARSDEMVKLLTEGEYAQSLRDVAKAERQANLQIGQAALFMALGGVAQTASGMAAGTPMSQISQSSMQANLEANQKLTTVNPSQLQASAVLTSSQASVIGGSVSDINTVSASTISELREKFIKIAGSHKP